MLYFGRVEVHDPVHRLRRRPEENHRAERAGVRPREEDRRLRRRAVPRNLAGRAPQARYGAKAGTGGNHRYASPGNTASAAFASPTIFPPSSTSNSTKLGLKLEFADGLLFPEREIKIRLARPAASARATACARSASTVAEKILRAAHIKGRTLVYRGKLLTSESLRFALETAIREQGGNSAGHDRRRRRPGLRSARTRLAARCVRTN